MNEDGVLRRQRDLQPLERSGVRSSGLQFGRMRCDTPRPPRGHLASAGLGALRVIPLICVHLWTFIPAGCGGPPKVETTFLDSVDLVAMTDEMSRSLAATPGFAADATESNPWVISIHRMVNHTNQLFPEREKWLYVARLRAVLGATEFARDRSIVWIVPSHRWALVQSELGDPPPELRLDPTHELTAEFAALTTTSGAGRSDAYLCEYQLIDLESGSIVWGDSWEIKRSVAGKTYD